MNFNIVRRRKILFLFFAVLTAVTFTFSHAQNMFYHLLPGLLPPYVWVGLGANANWNNPANWSTGVVPGVGNTAIFSDSCMANCDPIINVSISIGGMDIRATYAGTINQGSGNTITIGVSGWAQAAGIFTGADNSVPTAVTMNGPFTLSGGIYTATAGTWTQAGNMMISGAPTFNHNGGNWVTNSSMTFAPNGITLNNATFAGFGETQNLSGGILIVAGNFLVDDTFAAPVGSVNNGTIEVRGNVTGTNFGKQGTAVIKINGTGPQTLTGNGGFFGSIEINKPSDTLTMSGVINIISNWAWIAGTVDSSTSTLGFRAGSVTQSVIPGTVVYNNVTFGGYQNTVNLNAGTMTVNGTLTLADTYGAGGGFVNNGTIAAKGNVTTTDIGKFGSASLRIDGTGAQTLTGTAGYILPVVIDKASDTLTLIGTITTTHNWTWLQGAVDAAASTLQFSVSTGTQTIIPGPVSYFNVTFSGYQAVQDLSAGTMTVTGTLTINDTFGSGGGSLNNGIINASGNVVYALFGKAGTAILNFTGVTNTTLTITGSPVLLSTTNNVAKTGAGTVSLVANTSYSAVGKNFLISSGTFNVAGFTFAVNSTLTISAGGRLLCNGGTATAGTWSVNGEVSCGTGQGITWTGASGDNLWSTAGNWTNSTVPGVADVAVFSDVCVGANCNAQINSNLSVRGINLRSTYPGILVQNATRTLTIAAGGYTQAGGTFTGGDSAVNVSGVFTLSGGVFTTTSATWTQTTNFSVTGAPTFNHNGGTFLFNSTSTITPGTAQYNNVNLVSGGSANYDLNAGTMTILGLLTVNNGTSCCGWSLINNGILSVLGDVNYITSMGGTAWLRISGNGNQTVTGVLAGIIGQLEIASTGGTVSFVGTQSVSSALTYTGGTVDWGASVLRFRASSTIIPGNLDFQNVYFGEAGSYSIFNLSAGTMKVKGLLTIDNGNGCCSGSMINNGTIEASGDVTLTTTTGGTANLKLVGNTNQTVTGVVNGGAPSFEIASTGGTVTFVGTISIRGSTFRYTSGVVDFAASTLYILNGASIFPGPITYNNVVLGTSGAYPTFNLNAETMTVAGTLTIDQGAGCCGASLFNNGTIEAKGNVNFNSGMGGSGLIKISGTTNQTVTGVNSGYMANIQIVSTGGTVTLAGTINIYGSFTYTSGTIDPGTSTVVFLSTQTLSPNSLTLNNVTFTGASTTQNLSAQTLNVNGLLTVNDGGTGSINNGIINASGNVTFSGNGKGGTAVLNYTGAVSKSLTSVVTATLLATTHDVAKTGGSSLILASNVAFSAVGRDFNISSGILDLSGFDFSVNDTLTVGVGTTLKCNGGEFTAGTVSNLGTVNCPGYATYDFNWTGAGGNTSWTTAANWQGGVAPGAGDLVVFEDTYCGATCNSVINAVSSVRGVRIFSPYTGTITQGNTLTVGNRGWTQAAGAFAGGSAAITVNGSLTLTGGTITSTSGTLNVLGNMNMSAGTFTHNNGTVSFQNGSGITLTPGTQQFYNVTFPNVAACTGWTLVGTWDIYGSLLFSTSSWCGSVPSLNGGTIRAYGDVTSNDFGIRGSVGLVISGNVAGQTITGTSGTIPDLNINAGVNTVTLSGTIVPVGNYTVTSVGSLITTGSTLAFASSGLVTVTPGAWPYNNVTFDGRDSCRFFSLNGNTINIDGTVILTGNGWCGSQRSISNGTIAASGNVLVQQNGLIGTAAVNFVGSTNTTLSMDAGANFPQGHVVINKTVGAKVTQTTNIRFNGAATQNLTVSSGTLDMAGFNLIVGNNMTNNDVLQRGTNPTCGTVTQGGSFTGNAAICP